MTDMPTLIVEIGFTAALTGTALHLDDSARGILGTATLAADNLFEDVTEFVTDVTTRRGATRTNDPVVRYDAGSCTITFRNDDRRFDPTNLAGPYVAGGVTQVEPMRAVRIRAEWNGVAYPLWRGFTDQWSVGYDGPNSGWASVTCFDAFGVFAAHDRNAIAAAGAGETTSARITRVLNAISWPASDRTITAGEETVQATTLADNALTELQLTADTELGGLWVDPSGRVAFRPRSAAYTLPRSVYPLAHFGDQVVAAVDTTINLVTNPSLETDTAGGWTTAGTVPPSIARDSTRAQFGSWSLKVTWGTGGFLPAVIYDATGLTAGRTYTISAYVYVPVSSPPVDLIALSQWGTQAPAIGQWTRLVWTGTATSSTIGVGFWPSGAATAGQQAWIDGLQIQEGSTASAYVDGDQTYSEWDGIAHASTSRSLPELPYADVDLVYDALTITNHVGAARTGGTEQTAVDSASLSAYLTRSHRRTDLLMQTDAEALMWAEQVVARTAQPELRFASLRLKPSGDTRLWPQAFGRDIGERVRITRRPPGGGDPIVRECWVRGIEHSLRADLNWQTTFVLEQARDVTTVVDSFTRTVSNGWGTSDSGHVWTVLGTAAQFLVAGAEGVHRVNALNTVFRSRTTGLSLRGVDLRLGVVLGLAPTGNYIRIEPAVRIVDANNYYGMRTHVQPGGVIDLQIVRVVGGSEVIVASAGSGVTHIAGTVLWLRIQAVGSTLRARVWRNGTTEPTSWQITAADSAHVAGDVGVTSLFPPGNTNALPYNVVYDNVAATSLHTWT